MAAEAVCSRCKGEGHRAAACPKLPFFRSCEYCKQVGHTLSACPALRQCTYCKSEGHSKLDCPKLARKRLQASKPQVDDSKSETSEGSNLQSVVSTASTWATAYRKQKPRKPALTEEQEKEAKKMEKKLREIAALEARLAAGEPLDALQQQKLENKSKFEDCPVMLLVRSGYQRFVPADPIEAK